jgi:hypothetical protein
LERNRNFYRLSALIIILILILASLILFGSYRLSVQYFRLFFHVISVFLFVMAVIMLLGFFGVGNIMKRNMESGKKSSFLTRIALRYFIPLLLSLSSLFNRYKDDVRQIFIKANNKFVISSVKKVPKEKILVILPHCLQNSECRQRIRSGLNECIQCSRCNLGGIKEIVKNHGVDAEIATGGTSARKIIQDKKPQFVIAVACERDLTSGLMDVKGIPVYGILNQRPNGPCKDTFVDIIEIEKAIEHFSL